MILQSNKIKWSLKDCRYDIIRITAFLLYICHWYCLLFLLFSCQCRYKVRNHCLWREFLWWLSTFRTSERTFMYHPFFNARFVKCWNENIKALYIVLINMKSPRYKINIKIEFKRPIRFFIDILLISIWKFYQTKHTFITRSKWRSKVKV